MLIIAFLLFLIFFFLFSRPRHTHKATKSCSRRLSQFARLYRLFPEVRNRDPSNHKKFQKNTKSHKVYTLNNIERLYYTCKESKAFEADRINYYELFDSILN